MKVKVKIFSVQSGDERRGEKEMNEWFEKNPDINIEKVRTASNEYRFNTYIFYTKQVNLQQNMTNVVIDMNNMI